MKSCRIALTNATSKHHATPLRAIQRKIYMKNISITNHLLFMGLPLNLAFVRGALEAIFTNLAILFQFKLLSMQTAAAAATTNHWCRLYCNVAPRKCAKIYARPVCRYCCRLVLRECAHAYLARKFYIFLSYRFTTLSEEIRAPIKVYAFVCLRFQVTEIWRSTKNIVLREKFTKVPFTFSIYLKNLYCISDEQFFANMQLIVFKETKIERAEATLEKSLDQGIFKFWRFFSKKPLKMAT